MNKIISSIFLAIMLVSCGLRKERVPTYIEPSFSAYVKAFQIRAKEMKSSVSVSNVSLRFNSSLSGTQILGQCYYPEQGIPGLIEINPAFWNSSYTNVSMKEELIFHELGHCVLKRSHLDTKVTVAGGGVIEKSVMSTIYLNNKMYLYNYQNYMKELFGKAPSQSYVSYSANSEFPMSYYINTSVVAKSTKTVAIHSEEVSTSDEDMYKDISQFRCED